MIDDRDIEEDWDDSGVMHDDDYLDDPNLYLPNHFVTCFASWDLPAYQEAIKRFTSLHPDCGLDLSGEWNPSKGGALLYFNRGGAENHLTPFWELLEGVKKELSAQEAVALA
jgi:hypothetical protein